jgi:hypothetical protein
MTRKRNRGGALCVAAFAAALAAFAWSAVALADTVTAGSTSGAGVAGTVVGQGNVPDCPGGTSAFKITPEHALTGTYTDSSTGVTIDITENANGPSDNSKPFNFTATGGTVSTVYVKAKPDISGYTYSSAVTTDTNLSAPHSDGNLESIEFVVFCVAPSGQLAAQLRSATATRSARALTVRWHTASELNVAGYNVYGLVTGIRVRLNMRLIASKGSGAHSYSFSYRLPSRKAVPSRLWVQVVNLDGSRQLHSVRIAR